MSVWPGMQNLLLNQGSVEKDGQKGKMSVSSTMQKPLLNQNWADYSKYIGLDINDGIQVLSCKFCYKTYTTDLCKSLIEHLQTNHLHQNPEVQNAGLQASGTQLLNNEFFKRCSKIVVIENTELIKCKYCGVVYTHEKVEQFRQHIFRHYSKWNNMFPDEVCTSYSTHQKKLALELGKFESVEFARCADIVEVDNTEMYKCRYCGAIFDMTKVDTVRSHLYSEYITANAYPLESTDATSSSADQMPTSAEQSFSEVQPIEIVPETQ